MPSDARSSISRGILGAWGVEYEEGTLRNLGDNFRVNSSRLLDFAGPIVPEIAPAGAG